MSSSTTEPDALGGAETGASEQNTSVHAPERMCDHDPEGRALVISANGFSDGFNEKSSNVFELHSRIIKGERQLAFYIRGVQAAHSTSKISSLINAAIRNTYEDDLLSAYIWLAETYEPGDRIFLFGSSRGAHQVRVIAGMIESLGLIYPGKNAQLSASSAFRLYGTTVNLPQMETEAPRDISSCNEFKMSFSRPDVKVHFVGVWDTPSSISVPFSPETVTGMAHVCHFRQALALDERRVKFFPKFANTTTDEARQCGDVKEVWFAGSHSDLVGSHVESSGLKKCGPALRWMTYEAANHGLQMHPYTGTWELRNPTNPLIGAWTFLELLPIRHPLYNERTRITHKPHFRAPRCINTGQRIHESVFTLMGVTISQATGIAPGDQGFPFFHRMKDYISSYVPNATLPGGYSWKDHRLLAGLVERDPFTYLDSMVSGIADATKQGDLGQLDDVAKIATSISPDLPQAAVALTEVVDGLSKLLPALRFLRAQDNVPDSTIIALLSLLPLFPSDPEYKLPLDVLRDLARKVTGIYKPPPELFHHAEELLQNSYDLHNKEWIQAVVVSTDAVLSASHNKVVLWNHGLAQRSINIDERLCISFTMNGSCFSTGNKNGTVEIRNVADAKVLRTLEGHTDGILSLTFAPDASKIAAGSTDGSIRVWDVEKGSDIFGEMKGHTNWVKALAFSPDGNQLASGSFDTTVRIWSKEGEHKVLTGHLDFVRCLAFSEAFIVSGSDDATIRVWDAASGDLKRVLLGHSDFVLCVAFSPDFNFVASGSRDCTARLWAIPSGEMLVIYDVGGQVASIAFSPDGKRIVTGSGSRSGVVHIWNADILP